MAVLGILFHFLPLQLLGQAIRRIPITRFLAILIGYLLAHWSESRNGGWW